MKFEITKLDETRVRQHTWERWNKKHTKVLDFSTFDIHEQACVITVFGESRTIWCHFNPETPAPVRYHTEYVFASRTRHGSKLHKQSITFYFDDLGKARLYSNVTLNRQATIIGWWKPEYDLDNGLGSKHIGG